jgi:hypothetical protein
MGRLAWELSRRLRGRARRGSPAHFYRPSSTELFLEQALVVGGNGQGKGLLRLSRRHGFVLWRRGFRLLNDHTSDQVLDEIYQRLPQLNPHASVPE